MPEPEADRVKFSLTESGKATDGRSGPQKMNNWLVTRKPRRKRHLGQRAHQGQRHGGVLAYLRNCNQFGWGDLKEEAEKWEGPELIPWSEACS